MKISYLLTGNELMSGDTVDSNSAMMSQSLKDLGLIPVQKRVVGDDLALLIQSILELSEVSDVLIINGGLGPTVDDMTAQALAQATGRTLDRHPLALQMLSDWATPRGFVLTESNLKQCDLPLGCEVIENPVGSAVGFSMEFNQCLILCTPGVPSELRRMLDDQILARIRAFGDLDQHVEITRLRLFGITESGLQDTVNREFPDWPSHVELGFRVQMPVIEVKLRTLGEDKLALNQHWTSRFQAHFSDYIIGRNNTRLTQALMQALSQNSLRLVTAESCTGGAIAAGLTSEAGASQVFESGFVVYSNRLKNQILDVPEAVLIEHGAVSEACVLSMAAGALDKSRADIAIAVSGIAGPDGGSDDKPVGTVYMAWGSAGKLKARRFFLPMNRMAFQRTATAIAMDLVRRDVLGLATDVDYFSELKRKLV